MKGALLFIAIFALSMLVIPMIAVSYRADVEQQPTPVSSPAAIVSEAPAQAPEVPMRASESADIPNAPPSLPVSLPGDHGEDTGTAILGVSAFRVLDESTGEIHEVPVRDYLRGAVAAEMPAVFHIEALKAQAVAAHTYALYNHRQQQRSPDPALKGADFSGDPSDMKVYITEAKAREFYGDKADEYWEKVCAAADSVGNLVLEYDNEPIVAAYHAISAGVTEDASNVWVGEAAYLVPADSGGDYLAPDYETEVSVSFAELKDAFEKEYPDIVFSENPEDWLGEIVFSPSGYVTSIAVGSEVLHGSDVRRVLNLRSHSFEPVMIDDGFVFIVLGYGHGVGLSQYGADYMARQGADFTEILANYYTGAVLAEVVTEGR